MKVSHNWIKQYLKIDLTLDKQLELLTNLGLEVEGTTNFESIKGSLEGVVVGEVLSCISHPNADRLRITEVNIGEQKNVQIVCGAPNISKGQKVPVAKVGTKLYNVEGNSVEIKKSKIRVHNFNVIVKQLFFLYVIIISSRSCMSNQKTCFIKLFNIIFFYSI